MDKSTNILFFNFSCSYDIYAVKQSRLEVETNSISAFIFSIIMLVEELVVVSFVLFLPGRSTLSS